MSIRVDFNRPIDGGSGRKDLMRVLASAGPVSDDFSAAVVFSSQYGASLTESFAATINSMVPGQTTTASGSFTLTRQYRDYPLVLSAHNQDDGTVLQPFMYTQFYSRPNGTGDPIRTAERIEFMAVDVISLGSNSYRVDYRLQNFGPTSAIRNGVLRVYALGQGA